MKKTTIKSWALSLLFMFTTGLIMAQSVNTPMTSQTETFSVTFDVTPSVAPLNAGVGLSQGDVAAWSDMSPIIGFSPEGIIHTRNGGAYQQMEVIEYESGKIYHIVMTLDVPNNKYNATITPDGGEEVVMAYDFGFRAEVDALDNYFTHNDTNTVWGGVLGATLDIANFTILDSIVDIEYGIQMGTFQNLPIAPQKGRFVSEFSITASHDLMNGAFAFSADTAAAWDDLSPIVRFGTTGLIDVRNGDAYEALVEYKYAKDKVYKFSMEVDMFSNTYKVVVTGSDDVPVVLAEGYAFRKTVNTLNYRVVNVDVSTAGGGIEGSMLTVTGFSLNFQPGTIKLAQTNVLPTIDGDISDGFWDEFETNYCLNNMSKQVSSTTDLSAYWKAVWTEDALYVMANVTDDVLFDGGAPNYDTDGVHMYWGLNNDRNGSGGKANPTTDPADLGKVFSQFYYTADGSDAVGGEIKPDYVTHKIVANDTGYVFEASIPWTSINMYGADFTATTGTKILFDLDVVDSDDDGWYSELQWSAAQNNWINMNDAGEMELSRLLDNSELTHVIDSSNIVVDAAVIGDGADEYTQEKVNDANDAISTAENVNENATSQILIDLAVGNLRREMAKFVPNAVSVDELLDAQFSMYPNPVKGLMVLDNISNVSTISIYTITGRLITSTYNTEVSTSINLSELNSGVYIIKFNTDRGVAAKRFIKE